MPLVVFNYERSKDGIAVNGVFEETLDLPRYAHDKKWNLRAINAVYDKSDNPLDFAGIEISFPEIMNTQNILFSNVAQDNVPIPENTFRFYKKTYQLSEERSLDKRIACANGIVSEYPNLNLGVHRLENTKITCRVKSIGGRAGEFSNLESFCIILSFDE
jgi:hypothetical protein